MTDNESRLTVGIVGLGERGRNLATLTTEIGHRVLGTDPDRASRRAFERDYGVETFETPAELFDEHPDAAIIVGPPRFHEAITVMAFERDIPLYIEKPLAHDLDSAEMIADAAAESEGACMVGYYYRFYSHVQVLKSYIDSGMFGDIKHISARQMFRRSVPHSGSWYTSNDLAGGGALLDRGSYCIDLVLHLLDYPEVNRVMGETWSSFGNSDDYAYINMWGEESEEDMFDVEDTAIALIEFDNGTFMSLEVAWASNIPKEVKHEYAIYGEETGAHLELYENDRSSMTLHETKKDVLDHHLNSEVVVDKIDSLRAHLSTFFNTVQRDEQPAHSTIEEAIAVQRVVENIYQSSN